MKGMLRILFYSLDYHPSFLFRFLSLWYPDIAKNAIRTSSPNRRFATKPSDARKNVTEQEQVWCATKSTGKHWIQADLRTVRKLTKVGIFAWKLKNAVKSYSLSFSNNGLSWVTYKENGQRKVPLIKIKLEKSSVPKTRLFQSLAYWTYFLFY